MDIKVIFLQKTCAMCLVMYHLDVYKHKSVTFNQIWYLYFCWNAVRLRTESWYFSCISGLTCLFHNSLLRTLLPSRSSLCVCTCACVSGGRLGRRKRGRAACHADFTNTWLNQAQQTQELFIACGSSEKEIFVGMKWVEKSYRAW